MAPFCKAVNVQPGALGANISIYSGNIDPEWSVAAVPNGGYVLALLVEACVQYQSTTAHKNPLHVTAHFLQASSVIPFEIHVRVIKSGKSFTNLMAELAQKGTTRVTTHMIFGTNAPLSAQQMRVSINPPSSYARQIPLHLHPSKSTAAPLRNAFKFNHHIKTTTDPVIHARNAVDSPTRTTSSTIGGGGLEWGGWLEFVDMDDRITNPSLAFLVDIFMNLVSILPKEVGGDLDKCWVPTLVLSLEFKNPIRHDIDAHRTVGIYSTGRFLCDPEHRHDSYVEVWSAPSNIGEGVDSGEWRSKAVCLATATHMCLALPPEVNRALAKRGAKL